MKKPIRKRFKRVKGQRHTAKKTSESTTNVPSKNPEADDGMTSQTSSQGGLFSNSCSEESSVVSNAATAPGMSNSSVIDSCGFHDYITALSPKNPLPAIPFENEASNAGIGAFLQEAAEPPLKKCRSSTGQPPEVSVTESPLNQPWEATSRSSKPLLTQPCEETSRSSKPLLTQPSEETSESSVSELLLTQPCEETSRSSKPLFTQPCEETSTSSVSEPLLTQPFEETSRSSKPLLTQPCEETLKSSVSEPQFTHPFEATSRSDIGFPRIKPPLLPANVLHEVKRKVELFLHSRWMAILRQDAIHVVLIPNQRNLSIQRNLTFSTCGNVELRVHCKRIDVQPYLAGVRAAFPLSQNNVNEFVDRITSIVEKIRGLEICSGYDDDKFKSGWTSCQMGEVDTNPYQECRYVQTFRSKSCVRLVPWSQWRCKECQKLYGPLKRKTPTVLKEEPNLNTGNKYLTEDQMLWKLKEQQKTLKSARKKLLRLEERMQELIRKEGVYVDQGLSKDFLDILNSDVVTPAQSIFLQQQIKASQQKNSKGIRWHPTMIRLALTLYIQSPSAYQMLRDTGMVKLPSCRTLFDYSHVKPAKEGIDEVLLDEMTAKIQVFRKRHQRYHVLMADEMHICQNLVFQKSTGELVGYTTLDQVDQEMKRLQEFFEGTEEYENTVATKVLVYMVKGVSNGIKEVVATYGVGNLTARQLYVWTWDVIGALERSGVAVVAFISDGCSVNRSFIKMHEPATKLPNGVVFDTINKAARGRILYFMSDVPHLLKTIRNGFFNSRTDKKKGSRLMSRGGKKITWNFIIRLFNEKKGKNLRKSFKLNAMNVFPDSFARMKVKYAAEVLSRTVAQDLEDQGWEVSSETVFFIRFVNDWFECLNGAHSNVGKRKRNRNLNPYTSQQDSRFDFILSFLTYLQEWEKEALRKGTDFSINCSAALNLTENGSGDENSIVEEDHAGEEDDTPGSKRMLSRQTLEGIEMTSRAFIQVVTFFLGEGVDFINARIFTQDPLEQHFSKIRAGQGGSTNPNLGQVLNRNRAIHTIGQLGMKKRKGNAGEEHSQVQVTTEKLPKRQCTRPQNCGV